MPTSLTGANIILEGILTGVLYAHLHLEEPITTGNVITGLGYAGVTYPDRWELFTDGAVRKVRNRDVLSFPSPGGDWGRAGALGLWTKANIAPNPADPPLLIYQAPYPNPFVATLNGTIQIAAGAITLGIEVT